MWHAAAKASELSPDSGRTLDVGGKKLALFNVSGKFYALDNTCPHRGCPLGEGHLENSVVRCPWHAWEFDVKTGACLNAEHVKQNCYETKVERGEVWVDV